MAAGQGESGDILMRIVGDNGPLPGESRTIIGVRRPLLEDFSTNFMFEIDSFTFSVNVNDDGGATPTPPPGKNAPPAKTPAAKKTGGSFQAWRSGKAHKYPVAVQPIEIKRPMDTTSALLLQHCVNCTSLKSASLVKLKPAGSKAAGEVFLRIDFFGVLLTEISWTNDEPVQTTCKLIARKVRIRYKPQLPDGTLGAAITGFWSMNPRETDSPA